MVFALSKFTMQVTIRCSMLVRQQKASHLTGGNSVHLCQPRSFCVMTCAHADLRSRAHRSEPVCASAVWQLSWRWGSEYAQAHVCLPNCSTAVLMSRMCGQYCK